jgi:DNA polymerase IV
VGIAVSNLQDAVPVQLVLPFDGSSGIALDLAVDEIRNRYGSTAIVRGVLLGRSSGLTIPLLPD